MLTHIASHPVASAIGVLFATVIVRFFAKGYAIRKKLHDAVSTIDASNYE
jgi:hypothetical protein